MLVCRVVGARLSIRCRFRPFLVVGALGAAVGLALLVAGMYRWHTATLTCEVGGGCTLTRTAVVGAEREAVTGLRGVEVGARLVLRAQRDMEMGPLAGRRRLPNYDRAGAAIEGWLRDPSRPLVVSIPNRNVERLWGIGGLVEVIGLAFLAVYAIGSRVRVERGGEFWRHGSRLVRGRTDDITAVDVHGNTVMVTLRDGRRLALLATLAGRKRTPPAPRPDLEEVAATLRSHLGVRRSVENL